MDTEKARFGYESVRRRFRAIGLKALLMLGKMVGTAGFEPATTTPPVWCATRLRYAPNGLGNSWVTFFIFLLALGKI